MFIGKTWISAAVIAVVTASGAVVHAGENVIAPISKSTQGMVLPLFLGSNSAVVVGAVGAPGMVGASVVAATILVVVSPASSTSTTTP